MGLYSRVVFPHLCDWVMSDPRLAKLRSESLAAQIRELALRGAEGLDEFDRDAYATAVEQLLREDLPGLDQIVAARHAHAR